MSEPVLLSLVGVSVFLSGIAAVGAWRSSRSGGGCLAEAKLLDLLDELKGELVTELAQARAAVEASMREAGEAYQDAQRMLSDQVDVAVLRLRSELLSANEESHRAMQVALDSVFKQAQRVQDASLAEQALLLKDLKMNYERAIADLRAAVNQASARQSEALNGVASSLDETLGELSQKMNRAATNFAALDERLDAVVQTLEARVAVRV